MKRPFRRELLSQALRLYSDSSRKRSSRGPTYGPKLPGPSSGSFAQKLKALLSRTFTEFLPANPVAPGDSWTVKYTEPKSVYGTLEHRMRYTLKDVSTANGHVMATIGIEATLRIVDAVQYRKRVDEFDFDMTVQRYSFSTTPGDSLRNYFTSQAAGVKGSQNIAAIADPVVDALVDAIIAAETRPDLVAACKALDRVVRAGRYWVPHWYKPSHWLAYWDMYARPATKPRYGRGFPDTWWYDRDKAARIERAG